MRLSNEWFTALSENESGQLVTVSGRDELTEFIQSGKFKERVEITWKYEGDDKGMPSEAACRKDGGGYRKFCVRQREKDKLSDPDRRLYRRRREDMGLLYPHRPRFW